MSASCLSYRLVNVCRCRSYSYPLIAWSVPDSGVPLAQHREPRSVRGVERCTVYLLADGRCAYCEVEVEFEAMEVDHQDPWAHGGLHCWCNWACSCVPCNRRKGDMPYARWMDQLERARKWAALLADPVFRAEADAMAAAARREDHKWRVGTVQDRLFDLTA